MVPGVLVLTSQSFTATAAHADAAPNMWCPQACPAMTSSLSSLKGEVVCINPGRASYSPRIPMTGPPLEYSAIKAVGMSAIPAVILKPWAFNSD